MEPTSQQVCQDLLQLVDRVKLSVVELAEARGLTRMQLFALYSISEHVELAMRQVADVMHCDASNVTGIVDRLVAQGLVLRQECAHDRRAKTLRLTTKGSKAVQELKDALPAKLGCDALAANECQALHQIVQKLCV
jgi:DNA-binding MarR family transcriptional regulator